MPGSSVSACHMCHLHSHTQDNLVRTSPLRHSRGRSKSSSKYSGHKHHHGHSNSGYSSSRDEGGTRVHRSNSSSGLARLTDNIHSLPGSRSNSLSRYHREVSIMPDGGDTYGRCMRSSSSTRSLDMSPPMTNILDVRTTSLPRVSSILQPHIHAQPDILVNAMPRSRANSRSGSLSRNGVNLSQDNSHDYYLDIHRQRFKEEKRKHRFNLQTVMLIGCYTVLVMIAIVVGIVLCYQNGWFGLGPQEKISEDLRGFNNSNSLQRDGLDPSNRRRPLDKANSRVVSDVRTRPRSRENFNADGNNNNVNNINHGIPSRNVETVNNQRNIQNRNRQQHNIESVGVNTNIPSFNVNSFPIQSPNIPVQPKSNIHPNENHRLRQSTSGVNLPTHANSQPHLVQQNKHFNHNAQNPTLFPTGVPLHPNDASLSPSSGNNRFVVHNPRDNLTPTGIPLDSSGLSSNSQSNINTDNKFTVHSPRDSLIPTGVPLTPGGLPSNTHVNAKPRLTVHLPTNNLRNIPSTQTKHLIRQGNIDSNTIAKTLHQAGLPLSQSVQPNVGGQDSRTKLFADNTNDNTKSKLSSLSHDLFNLPSHEKTLSADSNGLTTQELLDLLAIRRMRDLLNSEGNAKSILDILRNVEPSTDTRLEMIRKETVEPINEENMGASRRGKGRSIQVTNSDNQNNIQIRRLIEAMIKDKEGSEQQSSNIQNERDFFNRSEQKPNQTNLNADAISSNINNLINSTINGAIIRLLNNKNSNTESDSEVDVNISGVSVFPLNSEDLKVLLESNPSNVEENIGPLSESRLKSLQILHRLIELNNLRQKVQKHIGSENTDRHSSSSTTPAERAKAASSISIARIGEPHSDKSNSRTSENRFHSFGVPLHNVASSFNRGSSLSINESPNPTPEPDPNEPDPTFAVMVRTEGLNKPTQNRRTASALVPRKIHQSQPQAHSQVPITEEASIQPGRSRDSETRDIIRAWTHMDSEGTLSKGRIHSDGSFTFTNCRPVEICGDKKNGQNRNQNEPKQN